MVGLTREPSRGGKSGSMMPDFLPQGFLRGPTVAVGVGGGGFTDGIGVGVGGTNGCVGVGVGSTRGVRVALGVDVV